MCSTKVVGELVEVRLSKEEAELWEKALEWTVRLTQRRDG